MLHIFVVSVIIRESGWHACLWETALQTVRCSSGLPEVPADAPPAPASHASSQPPSHPSTFSFSPAPPYDPSCVFSVVDVKLFSQPVSEIDVNYFARVGPPPPPPPQHYHPASPSPCSISRLYVAEQLQLPWMLPAFPLCRSGNRSVAENCVANCDAVLLVRLCNMHLHAVIEWLLLYI